MSGATVGWYMIHPGGGSLRRWAGWLLLAELDHYFEQFGGDVGCCPYCSKCLFEVAVATLTDQGFLLRHGLAGGNTALYSIPEAARSRYVSPPRLRAPPLPRASRLACNPASNCFKVTQLLLFHAFRAEDIAFREFPDDARFVYTASRVAARVPCSLNRRHGSPRQLAARTRGE